MTNDELSAAIDYARQQVAEYAPSDSYVTRTYSSDVSDLRRTFLAHLTELLAVQLERAKRPPPMLAPMFNVNKDDLQKPSKRWPSTATDPLGQGPQLGEVHRQEWKE